MTCFFNYYIVLENKNTEKLSLPQRNKMHPISSTSIESLPNE
ncbi:hypothetical protein DB42_CR00010, partial [Neochlamydia sp. EPS4]